MSDSAAAQIPDLLQEVLEGAEFGELHQVQPGDVQDPAARLRLHRLQVQRGAACVTVRQGMLVVSAVKGADTGWGRLRLLVEEVRWFSAATGTQHDKGLLDALSV